MYRIQTVFTGSPVSDGLSTVHFDAAAGTPGAAVTKMALFLQTWGPFIVAAQNWTVSGQVDLIDEATGTLIDSTSGPDFDVPTISAGAALPPSSQLLVRLGTSVVVNGRRLKGRIFLPGFDEPANVTNGTVDPALISGSATGLSTFINGVSAVPVIWHRPNDAGAGSKAPVTSASLWNQWAVLRQRRPA